MPSYCLQALPRLMRSGVAALAGSPSAAGTGRYSGSISIFNIILGSWLLARALPFLAHPDGRVGHSCWGSGCQWRGVGGCGHRAEDTAVCRPGRNPTGEDGMSCLLPTAPVNPCVPEQTGLLSK